MAHRISSVTGSDRAAIVDGTLGRKLQKEPYSASLQKYARVTPVGMNLQPGDQLCMILIDKKGKRKRVFWIETWDTLEALFFHFDGKLRGVHWYTYQYVVFDKATFGKVQGRNAKIQHVRGRLSGETELSVDSEWAVSFLGTKNLYGIEPVTAARLWRNSRHIVTTPDPTKVERTKRQHLYVRYDWIDKVGAVHQTTVCMDTESDRLAFLVWRSYAASNPVLSVLDMIDQRFSPDFFQVKATIVNDRTHRHLQDRQVLLASAKLF